MKVVGIADEKPPYVTALYGEHFAIYSMTGEPVSRIQYFEFSVHEVHEIYSLISATLDILSIAVSAYIPTKCIKLQFKNQC